MVAKKKAGNKKVKNLRATSVSAKQAKRVKGGVIAIIAPSSAPRVAGSEFLPYIEQKR